MKRKINWKITTIILVALLIIGASAPRIFDSIIVKGSLGTTAQRVVKGWFTDLEVTNAIAGSVTGNAGTVTTITGLAPDTATTQATQPNITSVANLATIGTVTSGTLSTGAVLADVTMTLGSDADGDLYYRSSNKLTRLAKGTALYGLRMNAGATAPEWAALAGGGDVTKVGTPVDSQIGVWTGDGTIEGASDFTYDGSNFQLTGDIGSTGTRITKAWFTDLAVTNAIAGSVTGNAGTVTTITGLAPDTATTQATQPNITSMANMPWTGMKTGTDGEIPTFDADGNPAFVATGTATHVLTSNGAGAAPTFQASAGGLDIDGLTPVTVLAQDDNLPLYDESASGNRKATMGDLRKDLPNDQTGTTYTFALTDNGKTVWMNNAAANVATIPANAAVAFATESIIVLIQEGAGSTTITAAAGVSLNGTVAGSIEIGSQYGTYVIEKRGADAWVAIGGGGTVTKVGTPVNSQVGVWTGDGTIEGAADFTYDGSNLQLTGDIGSTGTRITKAWFTDLAVTNAIAGSVTGNAGTVTTITGLAPDTATTQATQASITTCSNLVTVGALESGSITAGFGAIDVGASSIDGGIITADTNFAGALTGNVTGNCSGSAGTVATITGLAPDTATTQATQASITTCTNLTTIGTVTTGGLGTGAVLGPVTMTLGADADGDIYYRTGGILTRVAKGTADQVLTMNAGATAPEWQVPNGWSVMNDITRASDSTFTVTDNATNEERFKEGRPIRYADTVGTWSWGIVTDYTTGTVTLAGAPMTTSFDAYLQYGEMEKVVTMDLFASSTYGDGTNTDLLASDMNTYIKWQLGNAYCVSFSGIQKTVDTGTEPKINLRVGGADVSTADSNNGIQLGATATWIDNAATSISTTNYSITRGEAITINVTAAGGTGDAADLTVSTVWILE